MAALLRRRFPDLVLRGNGLGDLTPPLVELYARLAMHDVRVFLFSRKPAMIDLLRETCDALSVPPLWRPYVLGSVDPSTRESDAADLDAATARINGAGALAAMYLDGHDNTYATWATTRVVFGYHSSHVHTRVAAEELRWKECPATAGKKTTCAKCRRCCGHFAW
jgi:hypothetical protein